MPDYGFGDVGGTNCGGPVGSTQLNRPGCPSKARVAVAIAEVEGEREDALGSVDPGEDPGDRLPPAARRLPSEAREERLARQVALGNRRRPWKKPVS